MALDTAAKRWAAAGAGRPWLRSNFPNAGKDGTWRAGAGNAYPVATFSGDQNLAPALFSNTPTFYAPTVTAGAVALTPSLFNNAPTLYAPVVAATYALTPTLFSNTSTFYAATVTVGAVNLTPSLFSNAPTFYAAVVAQPSTTVGRPASDTSNSGWLPSTGSDLYAMVDEATPDAADYIYATATGSICQMALNNTTYPGSSTQVLRYRGSSSTGNSVIVRLKNTGGATVRTATQLLTASDTEYSITLTAGEIAAITSGAMTVELESA